MSKRGENIYKRKDGRWEGRYIKCRVDNKIQYGCVYGKSYREVKEKLNIALIEKAKQPCYTFGENKIITTFKEASLAWYESIKSHAKQSTIVKYNNILNKHLIAKFENTDIKKITRAQIIDFNNELLLSGGKNGKGLSPKTVSSIMSVLKCIWKYSSQQLDLNLADIGKITIKQPQKPMRILSLQEQQKISKYLYNNLTSINMGILLCLYTGIRIGEVCALKWSDILFDEGSISINKTMQRIQTTDKYKKTKIIVSEPKSNCSIRKIPLPSELLNLLKASKKPKNSYFLTGDSLKYVEPRTMQNHFKAVIKNCNIDYANFHALRHTFATRCVELGFDVKSLSEILGHSSVNITLNKYVHPSMELKQKNMNMLSELLAVK